MQFFIKDFAGRENEIDASQIVEYAVDRHVGGEGRLEYIEEKLLNLIQITGRLFAALGHTLTDEQIFEILGLDEDNRIERD